MSDTGLLYTWLGGADIGAAKENNVNRRGPILDAVEDGNYDEVILLTNDQNEAWSAYCQWFRSKTKTPIQPQSVDQPDPTNFRGIYEHAERVLKNRLGSKERRTFFLSPGTGFMGAVWLLLSARYKARLIKAFWSRDRESRIEEVEVPFDIFSAYHPDRKLEGYLAGARELGELGPEFNAFIHKSDIIKDLLQRARKVAHYDVTVFISGDSGTGKEVLSRIIRKLSSRKEHPFIPVNCGAIPHNLVESEFFGFKKGAFSGADHDSPGYFRAAHRGTLFLDEIGEMPLDTQVKLLRVLEDLKVKPLGDKKYYPVDFRLIAATNRDLREEVSKGRFREDLYYRLMVAPLEIPLCGARRISCRW